MNPDPGPPAAPDPAADLEKFADQPSAIRALSLLQDDADRATGAAGAAVHRKIRHRARIAMPVADPVPLPHRGRP